MASPISNHADLLDLPNQRGEAADEVFLLPASPAQKRLLFVDELRPGHPVYNIPAVFDLRGLLNVPGLEQGINEIVRRHEILRTTFVETDGDFYQAIAPELKFPLPVTNLTEVPVSQRNRKQAGIIREFARQSFDLTKGPLISVCLLRWSSTEHTLLLNVHHTVADGWSIGILCRELSQLYEAYSAGRDPQMPPLKLQYADYAVWQGTRLNGEELNCQIDYWREKLANAPGALELPTDHPRPPLKTYEGAVERLELSKNRLAELTAFARGQQVTPFLVLLAACNVLLGRYCRQEDILVGTPMADRSHLETESLFGFVINTVILRTDLSGDPTVRELLGRLREVMAEASANHELPFDMLVELIQPERDLSRTPVFQVMLTFQPDPLNSLDLRGIKASALPSHNDTAKFDLLFGFEETPQGLRGILEYSTDLFDAPTIRRMVGHFTTLLDGIITQPDRRISGLPMLTAAERQQILVDWNATQADYPADPCIHDLFEAQVARTPDATALVFENQRLNYRELNLRANRLADHLRSLGVSSGSLIGVCMGRSPDLIVSLLAVLKAGCAYVPLDPAYPAERLRFIFEDADVKALLTNSRVRCALPVHHALEINLDTDAADIARSSPGNMSEEVRADNLAYVIYTSGSTGRPKGVALEHRAAVTMLYWARDTYSPQELAGVLASTSICFDLSVFEIFATLSWGGKVILAENALELPALHAGSEVTLVNTVPSALTELLRLDGMPTSLRVVNLAGEPLKPALVDEIFRRSRVSKVFDIYGPSETSYTTCALREPNSIETIGRPIANAQTYVLDRNLSPVPIGVPGELYIGGASLAWGYLNRPELTQDRFIPNPFGPKGSRLYKSGDLARWLPDGNLQFLGRADHQVKVRGFRIELGEIESVLQEHPRVADAVVVVHKDPSGGQRVIAYVVAGGSESKAQKHLTSEVRAWLKKKLPEYMLPSAIIPLDALPLTPNGKIDRRALPAPERTQMSSRKVAPRSETERRLVEIWASVLKLEQPIGVNDNFFDIGGHSLLAVRLFSQIHKDFGENIPLAVMFQAPTIAQLATVLDERNAKPAFSPLVAIQPKGTKPPFFAVHGVGGNVLSYFALAKYLGDDQPFYGLQARGLDGESTPHTRVEDMAVEYLREIRRLQPTGPYYIGGFSFGCSVALEIAQLLRREGEDVALLGLIDGGLWRAKDLLPFHVRLPRVALFQLSRVQMHVSEFLNLRPKNIAAFIRRKRTTLTRRFRSIVWRSRYARYESSGSELPAHLRRVDEGAYLAFRRYSPDYYDGAAVFFRSRSGWQLRFVDPNGGWGIVVRGGLEVRHVSGDHLTITQEPHVRVLSRELKDALQAAQKRA